MTPFDHHQYFTDSWHSFHQRLKRVLLSFPARVARGELHFLGCLAVTFWSCSAHTCSMGLKSTDCASQDISWRTYYSSLLLMYHLTFNLNSSCAIRAVWHPGQLLWASMVLTFQHVAFSIFALLEVGAYLPCFNILRPLEEMPVDCDNPNGGWRDNLRLGHLF